MGNPQCATCAHEALNGPLDYDLSNKKVAKLIGVDEASIRRHRKNHLGTAARQAIARDNEYLNDTVDPIKGSTYTRLADTAWGEREWRDFLRLKGTDPDTVTFSFGVTSNPAGGYWNKLLNVRPKTAATGGGPDWPVIQPAAPVHVNVPNIPTRPARNGLKLSLKAADPQIGYRALPNGTYQPFHDEAAMAVFTEVCRLEQPDSIIILGDVLDLPSQGKYVQEAGFARTTQMALDTTHEWLATLRAVCPDARIVVIEGNHDKRMQTFIEQNALAAFGIRQAGTPDGWPVMSIPFLLRLPELNIEYQDAYPAATHWDDDTTRNIHGTRANSRGSTMSQYSADLPHINTWAGHTHRTEIVYKTVMGARGEPIESYSANPGCLCRTDGAVPSVHGALHGDGTSARIVEDWQQGFGALLYDGHGNSWPQVHRIRDGRTLYNGRLIGA